MMGNGHGFKCNGRMYTNQRIVILIVVTLLIFLFSNILLLKQHVSEPGEAVSLAKIEQQFNVLQVAMEELKLKVQKHQPIITEKEKFVWIHEPHSGRVTMEHVKNVFDRLGYSHGSQFSDWEVFWSVEYPFNSMPDGMANIKPYQKVNHMPGIGHITNKLLLSTAFNHESIPKSFALPKDKIRFISYIKEHPDYIWLEKGKAHRGIKIKKTEDISFKESGTFIQRYVDDPLLIDGRRFDFGVFAAITSIDPLRVYVYDADWVVRLCPQDYYPFDPKIVKKYVIADGFVPVWEYPPLQNFYAKTGDVRKEALMLYLRSKGYNDTEVVNQAHNIIRDVFTVARTKILSSIPREHAGSTRSFFELMRFDFLVDNKTKVHLIEANSGPELSTGRSGLKRNSIQYEQLIYSLLTMIGVGRNTQDHYFKSSKESQHMMVSERNIHVYSDQCTSSQCENNCKDIYCSLCSSCLDVKFRKDLKNTVMEHNNRGDWRRVIPRTFKDSNEAKNWDPLEDLEFNSNSKTNKLMALWIKGKCIKDNRWCI